MDWSCVDYCDASISCLDYHSDGTHSLQRIHWWAGDVMLNLSKSVQMKKQTHLHLGYGQYGSHHCVCLGRFIWNILSYVSFYKCYLFKYLFICSELLQKLVINSKRSKEALKMIVNGVVEVSTVLCVLFPFCINKRDQKRDTTKSLSKKAKQKQELLLKK